MKYRLAFFCFLLATAFSQEVVVISHPSSQTAALSLPDLQAIYSGEKKAWANDVPIKVTTQVNALPAFFDAILRVKASDFKKAWLRLVLQDGAKPPSDFTSDEEVLDFVARTRGAIGYVKAASVSDRVKVIAIK